MALTATPRRLLQVYMTGGTVISRFTNTTGQKQVIKEFCLCNQTNSNQTFSIAIVPDGGTLGATHYILRDVPIGKNETMWFTEIATVLELNDIIYAGGTNTSLYISSAEFTTVV